MSEYLYTTKNVYNLDLKPYTHTHTKLTLRIPNTPVYKKEGGIILMQRYDK